MTEAGGTGPFGTWDQARDAARHITDRPPNTGAWLEGSRQVLLDACSGAGVELGAYDRRIIEHLAGGGEPHICVIVAGLIVRAHEAGRKSGSEGDEDRG